MLLSIVTIVGARAQWQELYATYDDADSNGTGTNTPSVGIIHENMFIALCAPWAAGGVTDNYMIPYVDAFADVGRKYTYGYSPTGVYEVWTDGGFDNVQLLNAFCLKATPDSFIYLANNDVNHNLLVFKYANDTITVVPLTGGVFPREETGSHPIYAVDVDESGYIYVTNDTTVGLTNDIKIYAPISQWTASHTDAPVATVGLPAGVYRGIVVTPDGHTIFVSDYAGRKILKYVGSRNGGYAPDPAFTRAMTAADSIPGSTVLPSYIGLGYLKSNNILFAAADSWPDISAHWTNNFGRIYLINPNTGALISPDSTVSVIDQAAWNYKTIGGSYTGRHEGTGGKIPFNASGYTTTMDVKFDEKGNLYSQSCNGWTVEKWVYNGTLPVITGVRQIGDVTPNEYSLKQNYPNPFNPATTIEFEVPTSGQVVLTVVNMLGEQLSTLVNENKTPGRYRVTFDARSLPSGTYFYTLRTAGSTQTKKMLLVR
jgi:hypothetical protein